MEECDYCENDAIVHVHDLVQSTDLTLCPDHWYDFCVYAITEMDKQRIIKDKGESN